MNFEHQATNLACQKTANGILRKMEDGETNKSASYDDILLYSKR